MALMTEAGSQSNFDEREIIFFEQCFSSLDAKLDEVLMWCSAGASFELTREMKTAHSRYLGQLGEFYVAAVILRDKLGHSSELSRR